MEPAQEPALSDRESLGLNDNLIPMGQRIAKCDPLFFVVFDKWGLCAIFPLFFEIEGYSKGYQMSEFDKGGFA